MRTRCAYLGMNDIHALVCGSLADFWMAVSYHRIQQRVRKTWKLQDKRLHTEVCYTDTGGEIQHMSSILKIDVRAPSLCNDALGYPSKSSCYMFLAKCLQRLSRQAPSIVPAISGDSDYRQDRHIGTCVAAAATLTATARVERRDKEPKRYMVVRVRVPFWNNCSVLTAAGICRIYDISHSLPSLPLSFLTTTQSSASLSKYAIAPFRLYISSFETEMSGKDIQSGSTYQPKSNNSYYESFGCVNFFTRTDTQYMRSYSGYNNFMHSYGLKPWDMDDVEEGKAILQMFKEQDRLEHEEAQKNSGKK